MSTLPAKYRWHDFTRPGWYHIVLKAAARGYPVFARLVGAVAEPTPLGWLVAENWRQIGESSGGRIVTHSFQLMPDHLHILLQITAPLPRPLGSYIGAFKAATTSDWRAGRLAAPCKEPGAFAAPSDVRDFARSAGHPMPPPPAKRATLSPAQRGALPTSEGAARPPVLWQPAFAWEIKTDFASIATARRYIRENPAAAGAKRAIRAVYAFAAGVRHPRLPTTIEWMDPAGHTRPVPLTWAAVGNLRLLDAPRFAPVRVSRRTPPAEIAALAARAAMESKSGLVVVSPMISPGEKEVVAAVLSAGGRAVIIETRPINRYYKPSAARLPPCAEGRLLLLGPLRDDPRHPVKLSKQLAERLNALARTIAAPSA